ncbi:hypothetical protein ACFFWD_06415 [Bradyrhizobium erythrophlei]|uniref:hypothetical protein n=1 Tax=Bradyrhizobium erythrophlei TaxID=1437360 RepID=UPI0035ED0454
MSRAIYESEAAELEVIRGASAFSSMLRDVEAKFESLRLEMQAERIRLLFGQGKARDGLSLGDAQRIMWMYTSRDVYRLLVTEGGWSSDQYEAWLSGALLDALVKPEARPSDRVVTP